MSVPRRSRRGFYWSPCISVIWSNGQTSQMVNHIKPWIDYSYLGVFTLIVIYFFSYIIFTSSCSVVYINTFLGATPQVTFEFGRLSSTQTLGNVLLPSTLVTVISTWLAFAVGLSFWPSLAFLTVQQCLAKCDFQKKWHKWIGHVLWSGSGVAVHHLVESIALNWEDVKFVSENSWSLNWISTHAHDTALITIALSTDTNSEMAPKFQSYVRWQCLKDSIIMH